MSIGGILGLDVQGAIGQAQQMQALQQRLATTMDSEYTRLPSACFGEGLAGKAEHLAELLEDAQRIRLAHTQRIQEACKAGEHLAEQTDLQDHTNSEGLNAR